MTPDEVVKELEEINLKSPLFKAVISHLQDYQKLREKIITDEIDEIVQNTIEGIVTKNKNVHNEDKFFEVLNEVGIVQGIAQAIVTYLQQPTEPRER